MSATIKLWRVNPDLVALMSAPSRLTRFAAWLWLPEDASWAGAFRIAWGCVMMWELSQCIRFNFAKMTSMFYNSSYGFHSKYYLFEWVPIIPSEWMRALLYLSFVCALCITIGLCYRISSITLCLAVVYMFLCSSQHYLNHKYLISVICFLLIFIPLDRSWTWRSRRQNSLPTLPKYVPGPPIRVWVVVTFTRIALVFLRAVLIIVYWYAGFVKLNADWLRAEPLRHWLATKDVSPLLHYEITAYIFSYGGLLYDLLLGPMILWNVTFWPAIMLTCVFHVLNSFIFKIGVFPWMMIASTTLFFRADWPRRLMYNLTFWMKRKENRRPYYQIACTRLKLRDYRPKQVQSLSLTQKVILVCALLFLIWWILMPLRFLIMPGPQYWTDSGDLFAWRMKLRHRECNAEFFGHYPHSHEIFHVNYFFLLRDRAAQRLAYRPTTILQFSHFLADLYSTQDGHRPEIYVYSSCAINYRPWAKFVNQTINLAEVPNWDYSWIHDAPPEPDYSTQYPWNWTWDQSWWDTMMRNNSALAFSQAQQEQEFHHIHRRWSEKKFVQFIADRFYNGQPKGIQLRVTPPMFQDQSTDHIPLPRGYSWEKSLPTQKRSKRNKRNA